MKKVIVLTMLVMLSVIFAACGDKKQEAAGDQTGLQQLQAKGKFVIATTGTYPPYSFHAEAGSKDLTGFDVELLKEVFGRIGHVEASFIEAEWEGMFAGMDAGRFDSIHQIGVTDERKQKYDFSDPYLISYPTLIVLEDNNTVSGFDNLKGKKVYGSNTSTYGKLAETKGAVLVPEGEPLELLKTGRVDALILSNLYFLEVKKERADLKIKAAEQLDTEDQVALPIVKGADGTVIEAINKALKEIKEDGTYGKLSEKWFGQDLSK